jgi:hypothetical protein
LRWLAAASANVHLIARPPGKTAGKLKARGKDMLGIRFQETAELGMGFSRPTFGIWTGGPSEELDRLEPHDGRQFPDDLQPDTVTARSTRLT